MELWEFRKVLDTFSFYLRVSLDALESRKFSTSDQILKYVFFYLNYYFLFII